jgi:hypothetical protein
MFLNLAELLQAKASGDPKGRENVFLIHPLQLSRW